MPARPARLAPLALVPLAAALLAPELPAAEADPAYLAEIERWRQGRVERLLRPDGWLSLVGFAWLEPGANPIGSDPEARVVLPASAPARLGVVSVEGDQVTFTAAPGALATSNGVPVSSLRLRSDATGDPTLITHGSVTFYRIDRGGRPAIRVKDSEAPARKRFAGIDHFPVDPAWRVEARFEPAPDATTVEVPNVLGFAEKMPAPGHVVFELGGKTHRLLALDDTGDGRLFLVFADRTTGRETYGGGRFLYADPPREGRTVLDFNRAYNPPCVFSVYSTCPLPPPGNRLEIRIEAGEKTYALAAHS